MIKRISHIGIAVDRLPAAAQLFEALLGIAPGQAERVEDQKVEVSSFHVGESNVELTAPTSPDSSIAKFIEKRGNGIHHVAFEVENLEAELDRMRGLGIRLIDETPRRGANNALIAFLHPKSTGGILVELCEPMTD
jgi:methylmalonyl-CoA/ethylmalonyl-CoA epimerase